MPAMDVYSRSWVSYRLDNTHHDHFSVQRFLCRKLAGGGQGHAQLLVNPSYFLPLWPPWPSSITPLTLTLGSCISCVKILIHLESGSASVTPNFLTRHGCSCSPPSAPLFHTSPQARSSPVSRSSSTRNLGRPRPLQTPDPATFSPPCPPFHYVTPTSPFHPPTMSAPVDDSIYEDNLLLSRVPTPTREPSAPLSHSDRPSLSRSDSSESNPSFSVLSKRQSVDRSPSPRRVRSRQATPTQSYVTKPLPSQRAISVARPPSSSFSFSSALTSTRDPVHKPSAHNPLGPISPPKPSYGSSSSHHAPGTADTMQIDSQLLLQTGRQSQDQDKSHPTTDPTEIRKHQKVTGKLNAAVEKGYLVLFFVGSGAQVAYEKLPPCKATSKHLASMIPQGAHRFALHGGFRSLDEAVRTQAYSDTLQQLVQFVQSHNLPPGPTLDKANISLREAGKYRFVDIYWPLAAPTLAPTIDPRFDLVVDGYTTLYEGAGPDGLPHQVTISTCISTTGEIAPFVDSFSQLLFHSLQVIDVWRKDVFNPASGQTHWTGDIKMLVSLFDPQSRRTKPARDVEHAAGELPGYIVFNGRSVHLQYLHRKPWCSFCKGMAPSFHPREKCTRLSCSVCKESGHLARDCPQAARRKEAQRAKEAERDFVQRNQAGAPSMALGTTQPKKVPIPASSAL